VIGRLLRIRIQRARHVTADKNAFMFSHRSCKFCTFTEVLYAMITIATLHAGDIRHTVLLVVITVVVGHANIYAVSWCMCDMGGARVVVYGVGVMVWL